MSVPPPAPGRRRAADLALLALFDDLEQQATGLALAERDAEVADLGEAAYAEVDLAARLHAAIGHRVSLTSATRRVAGELKRVGADFVIVGEGSAEWVVPMAALTSVAGLPRQSVAPAARPVASRLGLRALLRRFAADRIECVVELAGGGQLEIEVVRVGRDFVDARSDGGACVVPLAAMAMLRERR